MAQNLQELYNWIDTHSISRPKRNLNRDFADAVPLAELLKEHYPRLVELHNYAPRNSYSKKIDNWVTLNRKVLKKLNISLSATEMENIANAQPGAIESLLFQIKQKVEEKMNSDKNSESNSELFDETDSKNRKQKMVPAELLEKQSLELDIKNEAIQILNQKVTHLQSMINIKDQRISELNAKIQEYITRDSQGFFNKIF